MQRLSRVGRQAAIISAIRRLNARGKHKMHTKGEICRAMGIRSTSKIRDMLHGMVWWGQLVNATTTLDGYAHEVDIFGLPHYEQLPLPDNHQIVINGVTCRMNGEEVRHAESI